MSAKQIVFHDEARQRLIAGLNVLCNAVRVTLGPKGRTVVLGRAYGGTIVINSGVVVAREIELPDPVENLGAQMVREVAARTSEKAGDGTTTATVLAQSIVLEGAKFVAAGHDPMDIKRGIDRAVDAVVDHLRLNSRPCTTRGEIAQVGTISANGDHGIGELIADAMERVGQRGIIKAEDGRGLSNELEIVEGMQFDRGYLSPYFINDVEKQRVVLEDALVLVHARPISSIRELLPLLEDVTRQGRPLLAVADDITGEALAMLIVNAVRGTVKTCAVKTPGFGDRRMALLQDIATVTGATVLSEETGRDLEHASAQDLGRARRIEVDGDSTTLIGGGGDSAAIRERVEALRIQRDAAVGAYDRGQFEERIAKLTGGVALIRVGAATELEMKEKKSRVEDALHATRAAVEEGIGPGGGVALIRAGAALQNLGETVHSQDCGVRIVQRALEEPLRQIVVNSGIEPARIVEMVREASGGQGFNAATGEYGDLFAMGVIDPTKVTRLALQNAASVAALILTTDCVIVDLPPAVQTSASGDIA
jgi:chaperonin GroEL